MSLSTKPFKNRDLDIKMYITVTVVTIYGCAYWKTLIGNIWI